MNELKTLKNIEQECLSTDPRELINYLKQEAIKWVKWLEDNDEHEKFEELGIQIFDNVAEPAAMATWIENFFNITEDDINAKR